MLWLALTAKNAGARPSSLVQIADPLVALDFDLACTLRLMEFETRTMEAQAKRIAYETVSLAFGS